MKPAIASLFPAPANVSLVDVNRHPTAEDDAPEFMAWHVPVISAAVLRDGEAVLLGPGLDQTAQDRLYGVCVAGIMYCGDTSYGGCPACAAQRMLDGRASEGDLELLWRLRDDMTKQWAERRAKAGLK